MNKNLFVVTVAVVIIALATIILTVATSEVSANSKKDRAREVLDKHIEKGGSHDEEVSEIKSRLIGGGENGPKG